MERVVGMSDSLILFGDSLTAGYLDGEITDELTKRLATDLPSLDVINAGIPGDTTAGALIRLNNHVLRYHPKLVTVFFGANDVCPSCEVPLPLFEANLTTIVEQIGVEKVVLIGLPYVNPKRFDEERPDEAVLIYNQVVEDIAERYDIPFVTLFSEMKERAVTEGFYQIDGLHFTPTGYDFLASKVAPVLQEKLEELTKNDN